MSSSRKKDDNGIIPAELLYRAMFEQSPDGILIIDVRGKIIDFNEATHLQLGYSRDEFARLSLADIDPYETPAEIRASIEEVLRKGKAAFEVKHKTKSGGIRDVYVITKVIALRDTMVFQTIWRDITERKQTEEALSMHRLHLEDLVEERSAELRRLNEELQKDIVRREFIEHEREKLITDLREAFAKIKILTGLLPMCAWCKKVRDDQGYWKKVETYVQEHSDASFTHGICPDCLKKVDPETYRNEVEKYGEFGGKRVPERRQNLRSPITPPSPYSVASINIRDWKKSILDATVDDFSEGGMCIRTSIPLADDMLVTFADGIRAKTGIVIWKETMQSEHNLYRTGIKFIRDDIDDSGN
jgi:PAS domain S-box-containing protein